MPSHRANDTAPPVLCDWLGAPLCIYVPICVSGPTLAAHSISGASPHSSFSRLTCMRRVDVRLPGKGYSNSHGVRPVRLIITMIKWIRTSRLSKKKLSLPARQTPLPTRRPTPHSVAPPVSAVSYLRLIDSCVTQLKALLSLSRLSLSNSLSRSLSPSALNSASDASPHSSFSRPTCMCRKVDVRLPGNGNSRWGD